MKKPHLIEQYATFLDQRHSDRVVEVGVHEGGSTALLALLGEVEELETSEAELRERARETRESGRLDHDAGGEPLMAFVVRLLQAVGLSDEIIADVHVDPEWVAITRGTADIDPATFRLGDIAPDSAALLVERSDRGE